MLDNDLEKLFSEKEITGVKRLLEDEPDQVFSAPVSAFEI